MATNEHIKQLRADESHGEKGEDTGCVARCSRDGHQHRPNGYAYAKANLKSHYNIDFTKGKARARFDKYRPLSEDSTSKKISGWFGRSEERDPRGGKANSVYLGEGQYAHLNWNNRYWPVKNQAHHILPVNVLRDGFTFGELKLLQQANFNINKGVNIVYLPENTPDAAVWLMLTHLGSHPEYDEAVESEIYEIKDLIKKAADQSQHKPLNKENIPNLTKELEAWCDRQMKQIFNYGNEHPGAKISQCPAVPASAP